MNTDITSRPVALSHDKTVFDLSIVIPVYNEEHRIGRSLLDLVTFFEQHHINAEIIVVDDGSIDATATVIQEFSSNQCHVVPLTVPHSGKAGAVLAGFRIAQGPIVGFADADMATPLDTWFLCRDALTAGAGVAIASREGIGANRLGEPLYRHVMGRAFNLLVRALLLPGVDDTQCGFKFFTREAIETILPRCILYRDPDPITVPRVSAFDVELLFIARKHGFRVAVVPITWTYGTHSKVNPITDTLQNVRDVILVRWYGWRGRYR